MPGGDVGAVLVVALALIVSAAVVAGGLGWSVLRSRTAALSLLVVAVAAGVGLVGWLRRPVARRQGTAALVLAVPGLAVLAPAVVTLVRGTPEGVAWFLNGDHPRHAFFVATTWHDGNLTYAEVPYPRGWHTALAAVWSATGAGPDAASANRLLVEMAVASLLLSVVLALVTAHLGHALAVRVGLSAGAAVAVGLIAGSATLLNPVLANYQSLGYENSLLAATVLAACCREVLLRGGSRLSLVVCSAGMVVVAHAWQLLLPTVVVAAAWCVWVTVRRGGSCARATAAVCGCAALALTAPAVAAASRGTGLARATIAGPDSPVPVPLLVVGVVAALVLAVHVRDGALRAVATVTMLPVVTALALFASLGVPLLHYYPSKLLWQATVLALPWVAAAGALVVRWALERWPITAGLVRSVGGALAALGVAYALLMPWGSQLDVWSTVDAGRVLAALDTPSAKSATVVWLQDTVTTDSVARILLDVARVGDHQDRAVQNGITVAQECALLAETEHPVVLSTAPPDAVRQRYSCAPGVTVLSVQRAH